MSFRGRGFGGNRGGGGGRNSFGGGGRGGRGGFGGNRGGGGGRNFDQGPPERVIPLGRYLFVLCTILICFCYYSLIKCNLEAVRKPKISKNT